MLLKDSYVIRIYNSFALIVSIKGEVLNKRQKITFPITLEHNLMATVALVASHGVSCCRNSMLYVKVGILVLVTLHSITYT